MKVINQLISLVNQLEVRIYEPLYDQKYVNGGRWDYVCYSFEKFLQHIREANNLLGGEGKKFIDVGCGLGSKVHLAGLYFDAYGIELSEKYFRVATQINTPKEFHVYGRYVDEPTEERIFNVDALDFNYRPYDVIYFFRPISKEPLQKRLEQHIFETAKCGAIIIPIYAQSQFPDYIRHLPTPSNEIYMKLRKDEMAVKWNNKAEKLFQ